jgi:hypothetical protein
VDLSDEPHPVCLLSKTKFQFSTICDRLLGVISSAGESRSGALGLACKKDGETE